MSLTREQTETRLSGIGASEIGAVAGVNRFRSPLDVWLSKPTPLRGPIVDSSGDSNESEVGSVLEPGIAELFEKRTGLGPVSRPVATFSHPKYEWALASPDILVGDPAQPVATGELKVVGFHMRDDWGDGIPSYVRAQAEWQMFVLGVGVGYVGRLIGTDFKVYQCRQDPQLTEDLFRAGERFWRDCILRDSPPPQGLLEDRAEYLKKRYRGKARNVLPVPAQHADFVAQLIERYRAAKDVVARAKRDADGIENEIKELIADAGGLHGPWGQVTWLADRTGRADYKAIAEDLAPFGVIPADLLEKHRSTPSRRFHDSLPKNASHRRIAA